MGEDVLGKLEAGKLDLPCLGFVVLGFITLKKQRYDFCVYPMETQLMGESSLAARLIN